MTDPEDIEHLKAQLTQTTDEHEEAKLIIAILKRYTSFERKDSKTYIDRLLHLAEKTKSDIYLAWGICIYAIANA